MKDFEVVNVEHERGNTLIVRAGSLPAERIVPPAGEEYAYERGVWRRWVEINVSPKGRSVRVWVDGREI